MTTIKVSQSQAPFPCITGDIKLCRNADSECCDGLFRYEPIVVIPTQPSHIQAILDSDSFAFQIETQFQTIFLLNITKKEIQGDGKIAIYFEYCMAF